MQLHHGCNIAAGEKTLRKGKLACKPGSVRRPCGLRGSHSSGPAVACRLERPTREQREPRYRPPIWSCSGWGLPCRPCCHVRGELLPRRFTLARTCLRRPLAVCSLLHFPSPCDVRQLAGILLCGARTFLCITKVMQRLPGQLSIWSIAQFRSLRGQEMEAPRSAPALEYAAEDQIRVNGLAAEGRFAVSSAANGIGLAIPWP